jgi:hypothetical protein
VKITYERRTGAAALTSFWMAIAFGFALGLIAGMYIASLIPHSH